MEKAVQLQLKSNPAFLFILYLPGSSAIPSTATSVLIHITMDTDHASQSPQQNLTQRTEVVLIMHSTTTNNFHQQANNTNSAGGHVAPHASL